MNLLEILTKSTLFDKIVHAVKMRDRAYREYYERVILGLPRVDYSKGVGYYLPEVGLVFVSVLDNHQADLWPMSSGKTGIWKLIRYERFSDPDDMVKSSDWQFLGYVGETPIAEMTFGEFVAFMRENSKESGGK